MEEIKKASILCVDDEPDIVAALERLFRKKYNVYKAYSGNNGLEILEKIRDICVIITDQRMPKMTGVEFLEKSLRTHPHAIRLLLTGYTDIESIIEAINSGQIYRYVTKPWDPVDLTTAVDRAVEKYSLLMELEEKNRALLEALEELKTLDSAKNHFMMLVNHELRTPLTVILSYLELFEETKISGEQKIFLKNIKQASYRLKDMIANVLELVSAETDQISLHQSILLMNQIWSSPTLNMLDLAQKKGMNFKISIGNEKVNADCDIIANVINRLVHNAIKFGDHGSTIEISSKSIKDKVEVSIKNKGSAISEISIKQILKPFTIIEDIMNHSAGLGLGLPLCQALLKRHGSQLNINCDSSHVVVSFLLELVD